MKRSDYTDRELINNYRFQVIIGKDQISFSKVEGISEVLEFDKIEEGGVNDYVHIIPTNRKQEQTLRFEKGIEADEEILMKMKPGMYLEEGFIIIVNDLAQAYSVESAIVTKWEVSSLDAMNGQVLIETFEVAHSGILRTY